MQSNVDITFMKYIKMKTNNYQFGMQIAVYASLTKLTRPIVSGIKFFNLRSKLFPAFIKERIHV